MNRRVREWAELILARLDVLEVEIQQLATGDTLAIRHLLQHPNPEVRAAVRAARQRGRNES